MLWFNNQKLKDSRDLKVSKEDFIKTIKNIEPKVIKNTEPEVKKYTLWQRLKKVLGNN
jgi:hypothetical protein